LTTFGIFVFNCLVQCDPRSKSTVSKDPGVHFFHGIRVDQLYFRILSPCETITEAEVKFTHAAFFLLSACCASLSCGDDSGGRQIGGACEYQRIHGRATITDVKDADPDANNCKDAVEVEFTFSPDELSAPERYRFADHRDTGQHLHVGAGLNPARAWARSKGLVKGAVHRCIRSEIVKGACTPVTFTFPDIDMEGWEKTCF
jgi:hypothetical protein